MCTGSAGRPRRAPSMAHERRGIRWWRRIEATELTAALIVQSGSGNAPLRRQGARGRASSPPTQRHPSISAVVRPARAQPWGSGRSRADQPRVPRAAFAMPVVAQTPPPAPFPRAASSSRGRRAAGAGAEAGTQPYWITSQTRSSVLPTSPSMRRIRLCAPRADG